MVFMSVDLSRVAFFPTQPGPSDFSCGLVGSYIQLSLEKAHVGHEQG